MRISIFGLVCIMVLSLALCSCTKKQEAKSPAAAVKGGEKSELTYMVCDRCGGSGRCQVCGGSGRSISGTCYACDGTGRCYYCNGQGYY